MKKTSNLDQTLKKLNDKVVKKLKRGVYGEALELIAGLTVLNNFNQEEKTKSSLRAKQSAHYKLQKAVVLAMKRIGRPATFKEIKEEMSLKSNAADNFCYNGNTNPRYQTRANALLVGYKRRGYATFNGTHWELTKQGIAYLKEEGIYGK